MSEPSDLDVADAIIFGVACGVLLYTAAAWMIWAYMGDRWL